MSERWVVSPVSTLWTAGYCSAGLGWAWWVLADTRYVQTEWTQWGEKHASLLHCFINHHAAWWASAAAALQCPGLQSMQQSRDNGWCSEQWALSLSWFTLRLCCGVLGWCTVGRDSSRIFSDILSWCSTNTNTSWVLQELCPDLLHCQAASLDLNNRAGFEPSRSLKLTITN